ncbi:unnamed protein product, partial [Rotaria sp. Silwood2]
MRNRALSLQMTDFDIAWFTMIDKRPTLVCIELYTDNVAKLVYKYILNKDSSENNFDLHSPLKSGFSNLAQQLTIREESDEFGQSAQADMTNFMYNNLDFVL